METCKFKAHDLVRKITGDYTFDGVVLSVFHKLSGKVRLCVEDDRGIVHIFAPSQLDFRP